MPFDLPISYLQQSQDKAKTPLDTLKSVIHPEFLAESIFL